MGGFGHTDGQQSFAHLAGYWHGACKVRRGLGNCVQTEGLHGALGAVHGRLKSLECAFNLLPAGLASDQFVNHVVAISRQSAATPKRQPLKGKHQNMCLTPVRRSPRIAGAPLYEMDVKLMG